jgi:hypothetical protein
VNLRIVDENVKTAASELRDLLFTLFNTLGGGDFEREDADTGLFKILDHVCVSYGRNDMAAYGCELILNLHIPNHSTHPGDGTL